MKINDLPLSLLDLLKLEFLLQSAQYDCCVEPSAPTPLLLGYTPPEARIFVDPLPTEEEEDIETFTKPPRRKVKSHQTLARVQIELIEPDGVAKSVAQYVVVDWSRDALSVYAHAAVQACCDIHFDHVMATMSARDFNPPY